MRVLPLLQFSPSPFLNVFLLAFCALSATLLKWMISETNGTSSSIERFVLLFLIAIPLKGKCIQRRRLQRGAKGHLFAIWVCIMKVNGLKWASQLCLVSTLFLSLSTVAPNRKHSYRATNLRASEIDGLIKQPDMQIDPRHKSANQCERLTTTRFLYLYQHVYCLVIKQSVRISSPAVSRSQRNHKLFKCTREYNITYICMSMWYLGTNVNITLLS